MAEGEKLLGDGGSFRSTPLFREGSNVLCSASRYVLFQYNSFCYYYYIIYLFHVCRHGSRRTTCGSQFSVSPSGPGDQTHVIRLGSKCLSHRAILPNISFWSCLHWQWHIIFPLGTHARVYTASLCLCNLQFWPLSSALAN